MKIYTLRDNSALALRDPISVITSVGAIYSGLSSLFGGSDPGRWEGGRYIPGDLQNRLQYIANKLSYYGLSEYDVNMIELKNIITDLGVWQPKVDAYVLGVYQDKLANPEKYARTYTPGGAPALTGGLAGLDLQTILLIGAGVFLVANVLGKSGKRRK